MSSIFNNEKLWLEEWDKRLEEKRKLKKCTRCVYDESVPAIVFNEKGVCNYCTMQDDLSKEYPGGNAGYDNLVKISEQIKKDGRNKKYDIIVGVSGGADSSYMLVLAKELGLRPLAVHFDNTWNSSIAVENISNVLEKLDIDLHTYVVDNKEYDDIFKSFMMAGLKDIDCPTDLGFATVLNNVASKYGIKYVFEGHSFRSEGVSPLGWVYMDAKYIHDVHKKYGTMKMKTYPSMWFYKQLKWMLINKLKKIRPLWYIDYDKEKNKKMLTADFDWQWYGGHHLENITSAITQSYYLPRRFNIDQRVNGYSGLIRSGQMDREEALKLLEEPPPFDIEMLEYMKNRLHFSDEEFEKVMSGTTRTYKEFNTYKPLFERLRPFFYIMAKAELIPMSFYIKYTSKDNI